MTASKQLPRNSTPTAPCPHRRHQRRQRSHDVAVDGERGRKPSRDCGRCALDRRKLLVPDRIGYSEGPQKSPATRGARSRSRSSMLTSSPKVKQSGRLTRPH